MNGINKVLIVAENISNLLVKSNSILEDAENVKSLFSEDSSLNNDYFLEKNDTEYFIFKKSN